MSSHHELVLRHRPEWCLRLRLCLVQEPVQEREKLGVQSRSFAVRNQNSKVGILKITLDWDGWENAAQPGGILVSLTTIASSSIGWGGSSSLVTTAREKHMH